MNFNLYKLNANYTTDDGVNLVDPEFRITKFFYCDTEIQSEIVIHWKDATREIDRAFETPFPGSDLPTVEFLEGQLLQIPAFSSSTIITP